MGLMCELLSATSMTNVELLGVGNISQPNIFNKKFLIWLWMDGCHNLELKHELSKQLLGEL